jgi:hypothetical protein
VQAALRATALLLRLGCGDRRRRCPRRLWFAHLLLLGREQQAEGAFYKQQQLVSFWTELLGD